MNIIRLHFAALVLVVSHGAMPAAAQPNSLPPQVTVTPIEGDAPAATRTALTEALVRWGNAHDQRVEVGVTLMTDATSALGCDAADAACANSVRTTLAVDGVIWGTARGTSPTTIDIYRVGVDGNVTHVRGQVAAGATVESTMQPLFPQLYGITATADSLADTANSATAPQPVALQTAAPSPNRRKQVAIVGVVGGGVMIVGGISLWGYAGGLQDQINSAPVATANDIRALQALEDRADSSGTGGNLMFVSGLVVAGVSSYFLVKELRKARRPTSGERLTLMPTLVPHGVGLTLSFGGQP
ncbi:MAG: hypothetical protein KBG15_08820 [Kofleriaceae bacterium]|nr:hypothetical protein [Kofleriaceae bacterium]